MEFTRQVEGPIPEPTVSVLLHEGERSIDLIGVHVPTARRADRLLKLEIQEAIGRRVATAEREVILCGDFNSPRAERVDGSVIPFAQRRGERALEAEQALMGPVTETGLVDVFRAVNGYEVDQFSWYWKRGERVLGFRLDHMFASPALPATKCWYVHELRERRLSDHSPIVANFDLEPR